LNVYLTTNISAVTNVSGHPVNDTDSDNVFNTLVLIGSMDNSKTSFDYNISGSSPSAVSASWTNTGMSSITVCWSAVPNPYPSPTFCYAVAGVNSYGAVGEPSPKSAPVNVQPVINKYRIYFGSYIRDITDILHLSSAFTDLTPNTLYTYQISAWSTDGFEGSKISYSTYTFAAPVSQASGFAGWDANLGFNNTISYNRNNNPTNTQFAVQVLMPDGSSPWLDGAGSIQSNPKWQAVTNWTQGHLADSNQYKYMISARNAYGIITSSVVVVSVTTTVLDKPILSSIKCRFSKNMPRQIQNNGYSNSATPYFEWNLMHTSFPVVGYALSWSTNSNAAPAVVNYTNQYFNPTITYSPNEKKTYYLRIKAQDNQNQWSGTESFMYNFNDDRNAPTIAKAESFGVTFNGVDYGVLLNATLKLTFAKSMSTDTITSDYIYIQPVCNELEENISGQKVIPSFNYDDLTYSITLTANLKSNWTYDLVVSSNLRDITWNALGTEFRKRFRTIIQQNIQCNNKISVSNTLGKKALVLLPVGALASDSYLIMNDNPVNNPQKVIKSMFDDAQNKMSFKNKPDWYVEVNIYDASHNQLTGANLAAPVTLSMTYLDDDNDGTVDGTVLKVNSLSLWWLDETKGMWSKIPSQVDKVNKTVTATITHFSVYALFGAVNLSVDDVMVAPVPWIPEDGTGIHGTLAGGITFRNLPYEGEIRIFTISGALVKKTELHSFINPNGYSWDGKNEDGEYVASGVYLWMVKSEQGKKTGKLMVVR
jgi:hypothetical protein